MNNTSLTSFDIHFCLATPHVTRLITPALHKGFEPGKVVILSAPEFAASTENAKKVFKNHGILVDELPILNSWEIQNIYQTIHSYLMDTPVENQSIVLNLSGGTSAMVVAAQNYFSARKLPMFLLDEENDTLVFYDNSKSLINAPLRILIQDNVNLKDFLLSFGVSVEENTVFGMQQIPLEQLKLFEYLLNNFGRVSKVLGKFNYYSAIAQNSALSAPMQDNDSVNKDLLDIIQQFSLCGMCQIQNNTLFFNSDKDRFFCNGGWLENYVYHLIQELAQELPIQDLAKGIEVQLPNYSLNELDVVLIANNRFYLIECKTRSYKKQFRHDAVNMVYKLDSLKDYAGVRAKAMLISFKDLPQNSLQRAEDYDIEVVSYQQLKDLKTILREWIT